jgi:hypothetical protein
MPCKFLYLQSSMTLLLVSIASVCATKPKPERQKPNLAEQTDCRSSTMIWNVHTEYSRSRSDRIQRSSHCTAVQHQGPRLLTRTCTSGLSSRFGALRSGGRISMHRVLLFRGQQKRNDSVRLLKHFQYVMFKAKDKNVPDVSRYGR